MPRRSEETGLSSEPAEPEPLKCPRCDSLETKFCYFNNYSTTQPRHFCRNCKRYWTAGGSLRNVPVGGGLRKHNKKSKLSKHAKDAFSGSSSDEFSSPGNPPPLLHASPSSSADGVVDESLFAYRPYFESAAESFVAGDCTPSQASPFDYMNARDFSHQNGSHGHVLPAEGHQQHAYDAIHGIRQPQFGFGCVDQAQFSTGKISPEPSQAHHKVTGLPAMYSALRRFHEHEQQAQGVHTGLRQSFGESGYLNKQGCSAEEHGLSHDGSRRNKSSTEDEDEGLRNVINVRYPYDWEQVSEVLYGGTPDFFHMPTF
eukprot:c21550_g2_i1 orf=701-1642(-)